MNESPMKIKAIAPYAGAKRNLVEDIIRVGGPHRVSWELGCGSLSYTLAKPPCVMETAVDLYADLTNLAWCLKDEKMALDLYGRSARTLMSDEIFQDARERILVAREGDLDRPDVDRAYDFLLCSWLGRNGNVGMQTYKSGFCVRYTANGGHAAKRWRSVIESIPAWHYQLLNVTILRRDLFEVGERILDEKGTLIYCDPPYFEKGFRYIHDFTAEDHVRLAKLYPDWTQHKIEVSKSLAHQGARGENNVKAVEVLLVNEKATAAPKTLFQELES